MLNLPQNTSRRLPRSLLDMKPDYIAVVYDETRRPITDYPDKLINQLSARYRLPQNARVLDVGFGRGDFIDAFHRAGYAVAGVDLSEYAVKRCQHPDVAVCDVTRENLPFADNSFDVVFHKSLLEHMDDPEKLMKETLRVLKANGRLITLVPDWLSQMAIYYDDYTHRRPYTQQGLKDLLDVSGFRSSKAELFYQLPIVWKHPSIKCLCRFLQLFVKPEHRPKSKFVRWSVELMILATGVK